MTSPRNLKTPTMRYDHVDSLRGIAILLVAWLHVTEVFKRVPTVRENGDWLYLIARMIDSGRIGVVIFFAISGFVICSSLRGQRSTATREFVIKRLFRLYPAYWLTIVLGSFAVWKNYGAELSAGLYVANFTMIPTLFGFKNMMGLLWTLETELVFYGLCVILFWLRLLHKPLGLAVICTLLVTLYGCFFLQLLPAPRLTAWNAMPYHLAIMLWGGIARMYYDDQRAKAHFWGVNVKLSTLLLATAAVILLPMLAAALWRLHKTGLIRELTLAVAYASGMAIFFVGTFFFKLHHRSLVWLGTISYSFYLLHPIIFTPLYLWARQNQEHPLAQLHMGIYLAVAIVIAVIFSDLVYRLVEAPCNRFARGLVKRSSHVNGDTNA